MARKRTRKHQKEIRDALIRGAHRKVQSLLERGWHPKEAICRANPFSPVGSVRLAKLLIESSADVNAGKDNWTSILINCDTYESCLWQISLITFFGCFEIAALDSLGVHKTVHKRLVPTY